MIVKAFYGSEPWFEDLMIDCTVRRRGDPLSSWAWTDEAHSVLLEVLGYAPEISADTDKFLDFNVSFRSEADLMMLRLAEERFKCYAEP